VVGSLSIVPQLLVTGGVVAGSFAYAVWKFLPASAKRQVLGQLLRLPLPASLAARLRGALQPESGCAACGGCAAAGAAGSTAVAGAGAGALVQPHALPATGDKCSKPLVFHPRKR